MSQVYHIHIKQSHLNKLSTYCFYLFNFVKKNISFRPKILQESSQRFVNEHILIIRESRIGPLGLQLKVLTGPEFILQPESKGEGTFHKVIHVNCFHLNLLSWRVYFDAQQRNERFNQIHTQRKSTFEHHFIFHSLQDYCKVLRYELNTTEQHKTRQSDLFGPQFTGPHAKINRLNLQSSVKLEP